MNEAYLSELHSGFETAYINSSVASNPAYCPQFVSNNFKVGKKVLTSVEDELMECDSFQISVAFITMGGITPLLQVLKDLEKRNVPGQILTTNYLNFSEPSALAKLNGLSNITIKMFDVEAAGEGFHTKGYIFKKEEIYRIIIGSSNMTSSALTSNREWNTKLVSTEDGEMAQEIVAEFNELWNSPYALAYDDFYELYAQRFEIIRKQREIAKQDELISIEKYRLQPNSMQVGFINSLKKIVEAGEQKALLISATGTGKTFASAFAMRELGYRRVLFLVHRGQLARQSKKSYSRVFGRSVTMGLVGAGYSEYDADYVFATVQTLNRDQHLFTYAPDTFDCIVLDEAHHVPANTYQKIMKHFTPKLWLGMTATPDKVDDNIEGRNVYEIFNYQIAYEIRLQQAMEENLLCPFHYFGITDLDVVTDQDKSQLYFNKLTSDERVRHILTQANYYGYSGDRLKGLIFCSSIRETELFSAKMNQMINPATGRYYRTIALNGNASESERQLAFERLAMGENDTSMDVEPLDYILSVEILNEGVDIVEVNQVIMLRPTQSPIVFIQQLGRGLRKAEGKEYVVILDFIGNYDNNFMIPVALSGDRSYNPDIIRKYVISGNGTIPGASTVHFDEITKDKIFASIDRIRGMKSIIKESYVALKNRLGRVPYLSDFYENGEVDPIVIIKEYKTYQACLESYEKELFVGRMSEQEKLTLEYLSKTILSGARPYELLILQKLMGQEEVSIDELVREIEEKYDYTVNMESVKDAISVIEGGFVINSAELEKYAVIELAKYNGKSKLARLSSYTERLGHEEFRRQVEDLVKVGLYKYDEKYQKGASEEERFVLFEKYSRRDVSLLMHCGRDLSSTMYGMKRIGDDVFIFVTYHKEEYVAGKPDYADAFVDNLMFCWDSQMGKGLESSYMQDVITAKRKHLFVKKSSLESNFYYMGQFDIVEAHDSEKTNEKGRKQTICKVQMKMHHAVQDDLLRYLQSEIKEEA